VYIQLIPGTARQRHGLSTSPYQSEPPIPYDLRIMCCNWQTFKHPMAPNQNGDPVSWEYMSITSHGQKRHVQRKSQGSPEQECSLVGANHGYSVKPVTLRNLGPCASTSFSNWAMEQGAQAQGMQKSDTPILPSIP